MKQHFIYQAEAGAEETPGDGAEQQAPAGGNLVEQLANHVDGEAAAKQAPANTGPWKWNDDLDGSGEAPDWFKAAKYGTVAEQAKAYGELESKFGGFTGAPEEYVVELPEDIVLPEGVTWELEPDDPLVAAIMPIAKDANMSQEVFSKLIKSYVEYEASAVKAEMDDESGRQTTELASIPDGIKRVGTVAAWAKANLSEEDSTTFNSTITDANALSMAESLIKMTRNSTLPDIETASNAAGYTKAEIAEMYKAKDERGRPRVETDKSYRESLQKKLASSH